MIHKIAEQIRTRLGAKRPETAIILGSGLGALADEITTQTLTVFRKALSKDTAAA